MTAIEAFRLWILDSLIHVRDCLQGKHNASIIFGSMIAGIWWICPATGMLCTNDFW